MFEAQKWTREDTAKFFRAPTADDDKYTRGVVALRTGSPAYPGAAVLGVEGAWRAGAGFVRYVGTEQVANTVLARRPETVVGSGVGWSRIGAWVIGSGVDATRRDDAEEVALREILAGTTPVVIDAGALDLAVSARAPFVLTPHAREFSRLQEQLALPSAADGTPAEAARQAAATIRGTVLLKGATTLVAAPDGAVLEVHAGTGWLATAGTGDVLAGVLGAVIAANPGAPLAHAAAAAVWVHGLAARIASGALQGSPGHPIVAMDVAEALPYAIADVLT